MSETRIIRFDETDSTNAEARRRAEAGEGGPLWLTASVQTAGRGRRGRTWETVTGNLAATYLFTTTQPPAEAAQVSFVAALAAHDLASAMSAFRHAPSPPLITLKWPNDLLLNGRKAGGILVESGQQPHGLWVAVGMGINLTVAPEAAHDAAIVPTSFRAEGLEPPDPLDALDVLDHALQHWLGAWSADGFAVIAAAWTVRAHGLGQTCVARLPAETVVGTAEGLHDDGALRLRLADGTVRRITAGDVFFGETA